MTDKDKIKAIEDFLKQAFCIDGECVFEKHFFCQEENKTITKFKLTDSRRGGFNVYL